MRRPVLQPSLLPAFRPALAVVAACAVLALATRPEAPPSGAARRALAQGPAGSSPALAFSDQWGERGVPWFRSAAQLNQPWGVAGDGDSVWIADSAGRRMLRFGSNGRYQDELGRAGSLDGLGPVPARFIADLAVAYRLRPPAAGIPADPADPGIQWAWWVDRDAHYAAGWAPETGERIVLGTPDEPGADADHFRAPTGIAVAPDGRVFVADTGNDRVVAFDDRGIYLGAIGPAGPADLRLDAPARLAVDTDGLLYVADSGRHRVVAIDASDVASPSLVATYGVADGAGAAPNRLSGPLGVGLDASFVYVADSGNCRVQIWRKRQVTYWQSLGSAGGCTGSDAMLRPTDVALDVRAHIYVADPGALVVHQFLPDRTPLRTFGSRGTPYVTDADHLNEPAGVAIAPDGSLLAVERAGQRLLVRAPDGTAEARLGTAGVAGTAANQLADPSDLALDGAGRAVVAERGADRVRVFEADGSVRLTLGGAGSGPGQLRAPEGVGVAQNGRIGVADTGNQRVVVFNADSTVAGTMGTTGQAGAGNDRFDGPADVAFDAAGRVYVADAGNHRVQVFTAAFTYQATIGTGAPGDAFDALDRPMRLAVGADDRLYVADTGNHRVQVFDDAGRWLMTVGGRRGAGSGGLIEPLGVAVDADGRLAVADSGNHRVVRYDPAAEPWLAAAPSGFGRREAIGASALAQHGDDLFAGTWTPGGGATIWRRPGSGAGGGAWANVADGGLGDAENVAVGALRSHAGYLYAGLVNRRDELDPDTGAVRRSTSRGASLHRSASGTGAWAPVAQGGLGEPRIAGVTALMDFRGALYAGTQSITNTRAADLWKSADGAPGSWSAIAQAPWAADGGTAMITSLAVMTDTLYLATCHLTGRPQVYKSTDGTRFVPAGEAGAPELGAASRTCISALQPFNDYLYAATGGDARLGLRGAPSEVWRCAKCNGDDWDLVAASGLGGTGNRGRVALLPLDVPPLRFLYLAVGNDDGAEVWRATDGITWEQAAYGGFGDDNNLDLFGSGAMALFEGRLHVATVNRAHGGEIWSTDGARPANVPATPGGRPTPTPTPRPRVDPPTGRARYAFTDQWPAGRAIPPDAIGTIVEMAPADDGTVFLLDGSNHRVMRLEANGTWGTPFGNTGRGPERIGQAGALAVDLARDRVYVGDHASDRLLVYTLDGTFVAMWEGLFPAGIEVQPDGTLWIADRMAGAARHLAMDGTELARFGSFGDDDGQADRFRTLQDITVDPDGRVYVVDMGGDRIRAFRDDGGGVWTRLRTIDLADAQRFPGCDGTRVTALGPELILAEGCIIERGQFLEGLPANHRGSDLYGVTTRSANVAASHFIALATYDTDRNDPFNDTWPAVVRYTDAGFDVVVRSDRGRAFTAAVAADGAIGGPLRLSTAPDGSLVLTDNLAGLRRRAPDGRLVEELPLVPYPSRRNPLRLDPPLAIAEGQGARVMGIGLRREERLRRERRVVVYADTEIRRYCQAGRCEVNPYLVVRWEATLPQLTEGLAAAAHEPTRGQYVVIARRHTSPPTGGIEAIEQLLYVYRLDGAGRRDEWPLPGDDREAIWADVDAGRDGRVLVLDTLNDRVQVFGPDGADRGMVQTPKDAWRVAAGPNDELFVLTVYGHVVRLAADGTVLARFVARPHDGVPPTSLMDLAVDDSGWVYTIDELANQVTVFAPEGAEDEILQGDECHLAGEKWVAPKDIALGDTAELFLTLAGGCGFVEKPADLVVAVNTRGLTLGTDRGRALANNLRVARQIIALTDLDRHRAGIVSYAASGVIEAPLTSRSYDLVRAMWGVGADRVQPSRNYAALRTAMDVFDAQSAGRTRVIVLVDPVEDDDANTLAYADALKAQGIIILTVNADSAVANSDLHNDLPVPPRAMGAARPVHRRMLQRERPDVLTRAGTLVDVLPANIDYVAGSAQPPAAWDPAARTLTWQTIDLPLGTTTFRFRIRPRAEGEWPTNVRAFADVTDGWNHPGRVDYPIPRIRVYGELPTATPSRTPTPTATLTPEPTATPRPTGIPVPVFLPVALNRPACDVQTRYADLVLALDTSGSMSEVTSPGGPTKLEAAREAARAFALQLTAGSDQVAVVQFNSTVETLTPLTDDPTVASAALDRLTQDVGTRLDMALDRGREILTGPDRRPTNNPVLILLTDGEPTGTTPDEVRAKALGAHSAGISVYTIGLGTSVDAALMRDVASRPEWFFSAPDTADLARIYAQIVVELPCDPEWP